MSTYSYEDLRVPGLNFPVKGTSILDEETQKMRAVFEVMGGEGRVTIEYGPGFESTLQTDKLTSNLQPALLAMTARMVEEVTFKQMTDGLEEEFGGGDAA